MARIYPSGRTHSDDTFAIHNHVDVDAPVNDEGEWIITATNASSGEMTDIALADVLAWAAKHRPEMLYDALEAEGHFDRFPKQERE